ncbi:6405_t:CDS:2, partial [Scutellospora calospora]
MAFAGATEDTFQLLKERFADCAQMEISISFRVPEEIAAMANDFTRKFMPHKPKLTTNQTNGGKKPVRILDEERFAESLTEEEIHEFTRQIDQQLTEKDIENTGKTILSTIHKAKGLEFDYVFVIAVDDGILPNETKRQEKECSRFIKCLNPNLIELRPSNLRLVPTNSDRNHHTTLVGSVAEIIGEKGEEE